MKPTQFFVDEWCNSHVMATKGNEFFEFVKSIQEDAIREKETKLEIIVEDK